jgi:hypothetical protein
MLTKEQYNRLKPQVIEYEKEQLRLSRVSGSNECPFCGGSKTTPFVRQGKSQDCKECDKNGMIKNIRLAELELI